MEYIIGLNINKFNEKQFQTYHIVHKQLQCKTGSLQVESRMKNIYCLQDQIGQSKPKFTMCFLVKGCHIVAYVEVALVFPTKYLL